MSKINQEIAQTIINEYLLGRSTYDLGDAYGLWQTSICNLISGRSWPQCIRPDNIKELVQNRREKGYLTGKQCKTLPEFSLLQKDVLIGSMLGDGSITKQTNKNCSFNKKQSKIRKEYLDWHYNIFEGYSAAVRPVFSSEKLIGGKKGRIIERQKVEKRLSSYAFSTYRHPNITNFRNKWYKNNIKIIPNDLELNPQIIAIWYFDDGCNCIQNRDAVLCTQSFKLEEAEFLCSKLHPFNLMPKIVKIKSEYTGREMPMLKFSKTSYDNLISLVKPYMLWDCFSHKTVWRPALKQWESSGLFNEKQIIEILELRKTTPAREIANKFNVHVNLIYDIVSGRTYTHLTKGYYKNCPLTIGRQKNKQFD